MEVACLAALAAVAVANLVGAAMVVIDKRRAIQGRRRIPERTLYTIGFLGGWIGMGAAMNVVHHKTRKVTFLAAFYAGAFTGLLGIVVGLWMLGCDFLVPDAP